MIAFKSMLKPCAEAAGIAVPPDLDDYETWVYPHWHVYCMSQLGAPLPHPQAHWDNACVIARFSEDEVKLATFPDLEEAGCVYGSSYEFI